MTISRRSIFALAGSAVAVVATATNTHLSAAPKKAPVILKSVRQWFALRDLAPDVSEEARDAAFLRMRGYSYPEIARFMGTPLNEAYFNVLDFASALDRRNESLGLTFRASDMGVA